MHFLEYLDWIPLFLRIRLAHFCYSGSCCWSPRYLLLCCRWCVIICCYQLLHLSPFSLNLFHPFQTWTFGLRTRYAVRCSGNFFPLCWAFPSVITLFWTIEARLLLGWCGIFPSFTVSVVTHTEAHDLLSLFPCCIFCSPGLSRLGDLTVGLSMVSADVFPSSRLLRYWVIFRKSPIFLFASGNLDYCDRLGSHSFSWYTSFIIQDEVLFISDCKIWMLSASSPSVSCWLSTVQFPLYCWRISKFFHWGFANNPVIFKGNFIALKCP